MKKFIILFVFLTVLLLALFFPKNNSSIITLRFSTWGSQTEIQTLTSIIKEFEENNSDIKIELLHAPQNYFQKLHLLFASKLAPDVIFINNHYLPYYANAGLLEELESDSDTFELKALQALSYNNKLYAIPRDISLLVIFKNKTIFKKCNIQEPNSNWDFNKFLETTKELKTCGYYGISFEEKPPLFYLPYLMSEGGGILSNNNENIFKTENSKTGLEFYTNLRKKYHTAPKASESANLTMAQLFLQQKLAMHLSGHWSVPQYIKSGLDIDTTIFPSGKAGSITPLDASGWAISKSSKHKSEAKRFVEFLSSKKSIETFSADDLIVPARLDVLNNSFKTRYPQINQAFIETIQTAKPTPVSTDYAKVLDDVSKQTELLFN